MRGKRCSPPYGGLALAAAMLPVAVLIFTLTVLSIGLIPLGIGIVTTPPLLDAVRTFADKRRELAERWCGISIPAVYRPAPTDPTPWNRMIALLGDPQTWRDMRWLLLDMSAGYFTALLPALLVLWPVEGFALAAGLWRVVAGGSHGTYWYGFVPVTGQATALAAAGLGVVVLLAGLRWAPGCCACTSHSPGRC
ncbi:hypothetical protein GCM10020256_56100 [Streptomyces thermocoprophilus]